MRKDTQRPVVSISQVVNAPLRDGVSISEQAGVLCKNICNGGTWTRDPLNKATDKQLSDLGMANYNLIYSVCMARTPDEEVIEILRYLSHGIVITDYRVGNEEYDKSKNSNKPFTKSRAFGFTECRDFLNRGKPFVDAIKAIIPTATFIYPAPFPTEQFSQYNTDFRLGWCDRLQMEPIEFSVDLHIYDRCDNVPINMSLLPDFTGRRRFFIEVGAIYKTDYNLWLERSKMTMKLVRGIAREGDVVGVQVMENKSGTGLTKGGVLTDWGVFYNSLDWRKVTNVIDKLRGLPSFYKFLIIQFDNGDELSWKGLYTSAPKKGRYLNP